MSATVLAGRSRSANGDRRLKILIFSNVYPPHFIGGAELIAHEQGRALAAAGHEVRVFAGDTHSARPRYAVAHDVLDGLPVQRIRLAAQDFQVTHANFSHPEVEATFSRLLDDYRPDVVHFHNIVGLSVSAIALARASGARTVVTVHDHWGFCFKNTAMKREGVQCEDFTACRECQSHVDDGRARRIPIRMRQDYFRLALDQVDAFVSPSRYLASTYVQAGCPPDRMHVVWNGIDFDRFDRIERAAGTTRVRFSFLGHFGRHKGVHTLLSALALLDRRDDVHINLVGDGEERSEYARLLAESGCGESVRFWGKLDNDRVDAVYAETDVLVLPSIWRENQPVSITEAMASGCAVIASSMGGSPELVIDGVSGFLFKAGDARALAERMKRFVDTPGLAHWMGRRGKELMRGNRFGAQAKRLLDIYARTSKRDRSQSSPLIVCLGDRCSESVESALARLPRYFADDRVEVTMNEWLIPGQIERAKALWVVDTASRAETARSLCAKYGLPLVVPEGHAELAAMCRDKACGLYYADAEEAAACLAHLLAHDDDRQQLARGARALERAVERI